jgi:hypothetical protein
MFSPSDYYKQGCLQVDPSTLHTGQAQASDILCYLLLLADRYLLIVWKAIQNSVFVSTVVYQGSLWVL